MSSQVHNPDDATRPDELVPPSESHDPSAAEGYLARLAGAVLSKGPSDP